MLDRNLNYFQISSFTSIMILTTFLFEIPTGIIADKFGRKISIIIALFFQLIGEIIFIFASNYIVFVLITIIGGIGWAFLSGCVESLIYDSLPESNKSILMKKTMRLI